MYNIETGPEPLSPGQVEDNRITLRGSFIPETAQDTTLRELGILRLLHGNPSSGGRHGFTARPDRLPLGGGTLVWSANLLMVPRVNYHAEIIPGEVPFVRVVDEKGQILVEVQAEFLRSVTGGGLKILTPARYLIVEEDLAVYGPALLLASQGQQPRIHDNSPFTKILDESYQAGEKLFELELNVGAIKHDRVVIDPRNRRLVRRRIERPLALGR